jgi:hypothetical protein
MDRYISFVHTSDWEPNVTIRAYSKGSVERAQEFRAHLFAKLSAFLEALIRKLPDLFLHAGDLFQARVDTDELSEWTIRQFDEMEDLTGRPFGAAHRSPHSVSATMMGFRSRPFRVSTYSECRLESPARASKIPAATKSSNRLASTFGAIPRLR